MADIIKIEFGKKKKKISFEEITSWCLDDLLDNWTRFSNSNQLNDFFRSSIPQSTKDDVNYIQDLNSLSSLETLLNVHVQVISPSFSENEIGWVTAFKISGKTICTPFMATEAHARAFAILLNLKVRRELAEAGI